MCAESHLTLANETQKQCASSDSRRTRGRDAIIASRSRDKKEK